MLNKLEDISYKGTNILNKLCSDYLFKENTELEKLYGLHPNDPNAFEEQIKLKKSHKINRKILVEHLLNQYKSANITERNDLIHSLGDENTFTITTGHQLNLFTGPQYFIYKIASTIHLSKQLKAQYPNFKFVPIYWLASEDHDFDEINHTYINSKRIEWISAQTGAVGEFSLEGIGNALATLKDALGNSKTSTELYQMIELAYCNSKTLSEATLKLTDCLFKQHELLCLDANSIALKKEFVPLIDRELQDTFLVRSTQHTRAYLNKTYYNQVNPREINLFYKHDRIRARILKQDTRYIVQDTELIFSKQELTDLLHAHPDRFSPNAVFRPLYQESILPNIAYIGGAAEVAYWLELKQAFDVCDIPMPLIMLRNSFAFTDRKTIENIKQARLTSKDMFRPLDAILKKSTLENSPFDLELNEELKSVERIFKSLEEKSKSSGLNLTTHLSSQQAKTTKILTRTSKKLIAAQKRKDTIGTERLISIHNALYPNQKLIERSANIAQVLLECKDIPEVITILVHYSNPLNNSIQIIYAD